MPPRRERKAKKFGLDDFTGAVRAKEPVRQQEFTAATLRHLHRVGVLHDPLFIQPQPFQNTDGRVDGRMPRSLIPLAVPSAVRHLLGQHITDKLLEPVILVSEMCENREHHSCDARFAPATPAVVDAAIPL